MARSSYSLGALLMASLLLVVAQVAPGQAQAPKADELKFNGNAADEQQQQQQQQKQDTTIIDNNSRPLNGPQQPESLENNFYEDQHAPRPGPLPWPFTPSFGFGSGPSPMRGQSLLHQLMGAPGRLFDQLDRPMRMMDRHMEQMSHSLEQQFRDLERQASTGEGQDVSYFQRNGVAYVRTCSTKRVMPSGQDEQKELGPVSPTPVLPSNDNQQNQQGHEGQQGQQLPELINNQHQGFSSEMPSPPSTTSA